MATTKWPAGQAALRKMTEPQQARVAGAIRTQARRHPSKLVGPKKHRRKDAPGHLDREVNDRLLRLKLYQEHDRVVKSAIHKYKSGEDFLEEKMAAAAVEKRMAKRREVISAKIKEFEPSIWKYAAMKQKIDEREAKGLKPTKKQADVLRIAKRSYTRLNRYREEADRIAPNGSKTKSIRWVRMAGIAQQAEQGPLQFDYRAIYTGDGQATFAGV